jgi:membrane protein implicated in regulation of membrane protease activity
MLSWIRRSRTCRAGLAQGAGFGVAKYLLIQIPGWIVVGGGLWLLGWWGVLPRWMLFALFFLWVIKDLMLYPLVRKANAPVGRTGGQRLIGAEGVAEERLAPSGYVRVGAERWRAEALESDEPIAAGSRVRVEAVRGLTLLIRPRE